MTALILYPLAIALSVISLLNDRAKTVAAFRKALSMFLRLMPDVLAVMLFVGLSLSLISPQLISRLIGESSGILGVGLSLLIGSIAMLPSFVVFPLGATLVEHGGGLSQVGALMTSLMSVGLVSMPVESKLFGAKFARLRNASGVLLAVLFSAIVSGIFV